MLGKEVTAECNRLGIDYVASDREVDISDPTSLRKFIDGKQMEYVINCAAYTAVDLAEKESDAAFLINTAGAQNLAKLTKEINSQLIHISTDYVFDGASTRPYNTSDATSPISAYGRSKSEGEKAILNENTDAVIIRTAWLYGMMGHNFVKTMLGLMGKKNEIRIVDDQHGSPTLASDLARAIMEIVKNDHSAKGIYHFTNSGEATWFEFASQIYKLALKYNIIEREVRLIPITTYQYPTAAARPMNSTLNCSRLTSEFGITQRPWQEALEDLFLRLTKEL